jgi:hypothetical protein
MIMASPFLLVTIRKADTSNASRFPLIILLDSIILLKILDGTFYCSIP